MPGSYAIPPVSGAPARVPATFTAGDQPMKPTDVAQNFLHKLEMSSFLEAEGYLAYDFIMIGAAPQPVGKKTFMDIMQALITGIPDLAFNPGNITGLDNEVTLTLNITGTHTNDMPPLLPGMPTIRATGRSISLHAEPATFLVRGDRITQIEIETDSEGGIQGILDQLGVEIPLGLQTPISTAVGERP